MKLQEKLIGIDFNLPFNCDQDTFTYLLKGLVNAHRQDSLLTTVRLSTKETFRQMCSQIQRQSPSNNFLMFRSISLHGICSDNISSVSSGHRNLLESDGEKTLSLRHS